MEVASLALLGLLAGTAGGLVGLGGSIVIIPVLTVVLGRDQHLAQATAMIVNFFIAVPAAIRHALAGTTNRRVVLCMLPAAMVAIFFGVEVSNRLDGALLSKIFGVFLIYVGAMKMLQLYRDGGHPVRPEPNVGWLPSSAAGAGMGFSAGLLGIGGGPVVIPLLQRLCRLSLRKSIPISATAMCMTSLVGAVHKNLSLSGLTGPGGESLGLSIMDSVVTAGCIVPTAAVGALFGAGLTHRLPLLWVRLAFVVLISGASLAMLGLV
jgi:uncharacterized membrane protein YfcA